MNPIEGVSVIAYQNVVGEEYEWVSETFTTLADGSYVIAETSRGRFCCQLLTRPVTRTTFYDGAYLLQDGTPVPVTVENDTPGIDAVLELPGTITGTITAAGGGPLAGEWADAYRETSPGVWDFIVTGVSEVDGSYTTGPIPPGTYRMRFGITSGMYRAEYFNGVFSASEATTIGVDPGVASTGIDASLDLITTDVTVSATGIDKTYDGTSTASVTLTSVDFNPGDNVTATYTSAAFDDKNVGDGKNVSVTGIALSGPDAGKYVLLNSTASTTASITALDITGAFTADDKPYDGNTDATVASRSLVGTIPGDVVTLDGGTAQFDTSSVGTGKTVTLLGRHSSAEVDAGKLRP